jgi:hypothetical protein
MMLDKHHEELNNDAAEANEQNNLKRLTLVGQFGGLGENSTNVTLADAAIHSFFGPEFG